MWASADMYDPHCVPLLLQLPGIHIFIIYNFSEAALFPQMIADMNMVRLSSFDKFERSLEVTLPVIWNSVD